MWKTFLKYVVMFAQHCTSDNHTSCQLLICVGSHDPSEVYTYPTCKAHVVIYPVTSDHDINLILVGIMTPATTPGQRKHLVSQSSVLSQPDLLSPEELFSQYT